MIKWPLPWSYHFQAPIGTCENEAHKFDLKTISLVGGFLLLHWVVYMDHKIYNKILPLQLQINRRWNKSQPSPQCHPILWKHHHRHHHHLHHQSDACTTISINTIPITIITNIIIRLPSSPSSSLSCMHHQEEAKPQYLLLPTFLPPTSSRIGESYGRRYHRHHH